MNSSSRPGFVPAEPALSWQSKVSSEHKFLVRVRVRVRLNRFSEGGLGVLGVNITPWQG